MIHILEYVLKFPTVGIGNNFVRQSITTFTLNRVYLKLNLTKLFVLNFFAILSLTYCLLSTLQGRLLCRLSLLEWWMCISSVTVMMWSFRRIYQLSSVVLSHCWLVYRSRKDNVDCTNSIGKITPLKTSDL